MSEILVLATVNLCTFLLGCYWGSRRTIRSQPPSMPMSLPGIYEHPLAPGLSSRFGYCPECRHVYPADTTHDSCPRDE